MIEGRVPMVIVPDDDPELMTRLLQAGWFAAGRFEGVERRGSGSVAPIERPGQGDGGRFGRADFAVYRPDGSRNANLPGEGGAGGFANSWRPAGAAPRPAVIPATISKPAVGTRPRDGALIEVAGPADLIRLFRLLRWLRTRRRVPQSKRPGEREGPETSSGAPSRESGSVAPDTSVDPAPELPKAETDLHHMAPQGGHTLNGGRDPRFVQDVLRRYGFSLHDVENLVRLSRRFHQKLHTSAYYRYIRRKLENVADRDYVVDFLDKLKTRLQDADQIFQKTGEMPDWDAE